MTAQFQFRAGDLRHRVYLDALDPVRTDTGSEEAQWTPMLRLFAAIEPLTGREIAAQGGIDAQSNTQIRLRWTPRTALIDPTWRVRHVVLGVETLYNIQSVTDTDFRHQELVLLCQSGLNDG